jgi:hypothetical protein
MLIMVVRFLLKLLTYCRRMEWMFTCFPSVQTLDFRCNVEPTLYVRYVVRHRLINTTDISVQLVSLLIAGLVWHGSVH